MLTLPVAHVTATREVLAVIFSDYLVCTTVAFMLYYSFIAQAGEARTALRNYLIPIFARHSALSFGGYDE